MRESAILRYNQDVIGIDTRRWIVYFNNEGKVESVMRTLTLALAVLLAAHLGAVPASCPCAAPSDHSPKGSCGCCAADSQTELSDTCCDAGVSATRDARLHTPLRFEGCCECRCAMQEPASAEQSDVRHEFRASMAFCPVIQPEPLVSSVGATAGLSPFPAAMNGSLLFVVHCVFRR